MSMTVQIACSTMYTPHTSYYVIGHKMKDKKNIKPRANASCRDSVLKYLVACYKKRQAIPRVGVIAEDLNISDRTVGRNYKRLVKQKLIKAHMGKVTHIKINGTFKKTRTVKFIRKVPPKINLNKLFQYIYAKNKKESIPSRVEIAKAFNTHEKAIYHALRKLQDLKWIKIDSSGGISFIKHLTEEDSAEESADESSLENSEESVCSTVSSFEEPTKNKDDCSSDSADDDHSESLESSLDSTYSYDHSSENEDDSSYQPTTTTTTTKEVSARVADKESYKSAFMKVASSVETNISIAGKGFSHQASFRNNLAFFLNKPKKKQLNSLSRDVVVIHQAPLTFIFSNNRSAFRKVDKKQSPSFQSNIQAENEVVSVREKLT